VRSPHTHTDTHRETECERVLTERAVMGKKNKIKEVYEEKNDCFCFYCGE
jgi:hypothetical protein